jgi:hypothetical protein
MNIYLGNLSTEEIEKRLGITFSDELKQFMNENHQPKAENIQKGKWHCFDIPFDLHCGGMEIAQKIYDAIKDQSHLCKETLQISVKK